MTILFTIEYVLRLLTTALRASGRKIFVFLGTVLTLVVMVTGYGIIAVPTGIVTVELAGASRIKVSTQFCPNCGSQGHDADARFCKYCGASLEIETT